MPALTMCHPCVVCGKHSHEHAAWFLVVENSWLDRIKILSWHPVLAEQDEMHSVCGKRHLKLLIAHWLMCANLQFQIASHVELALADHEDVPGDVIDLPLPGQLVGELAVHRESLSRLWTGSPEARESIFGALLDGLPGRESPRLETPGETTEAVCLEPVTGRADLRECFQELAFQ